MTGMKKVIPGNGEKVLTAVSEEAAKQNVKEKLENQKKVG